MSARFSGSQTAGDRRRRRIAADETHGEAPSDAGTSGDGRPLPARRPTGRFPLRRIIARSPWKLGAAGLTAAAACAAVVAAGYIPAVQSGTYGPGLAALCDPQTGRLPVAVGGLLLLAAAQLAWLVRWARARSLRDFRGGYRIWWWTSLALAAAGTALLTDAHSAFAATLVWLTGRTPLGSDAAYRLAPALAALVILLPSLQRDMRGCRTSRTLLLLAALLWTAGGAATLAGDRVTAVTAQLGSTIPTAAIDVSLLLAGTAAAFTSLLFHARHVVYESVEPPEQPARRKQADAESEAADGETEKKPKRSSRRSNRAKPTEEKEDAKPAATKEKPEPKPADEPPKVARPHFVLKDQVLKDPPKPAPAPPKPEPVAAKPQPKPEPPKPEPKSAPVAAKPAPPQPADEDDDDSAEIGGRQVRLDGPEDALRGLSKRERRKLRKEMKTRDHAEH